MRKLKNKYSALDYGMSVVGYTRKPLTVKVKGSKNQHKDRRWIYFFEGSRLVGDCNPIFFQYHFTKVRK